MEHMPEVYEEPEDNELSRELEAIAIAHSRRDVPNKMPNSSSMPLGSSGDDPLEEIRELASSCDMHASALGHALRALHVKITECRQHNDGRGPSGLMITSVLERCAAKHFVGTILRTSRGPLSQQRSFREQVELWSTSLSPMLRKSM